MAPLLQLVLDGRIKPSDIVTHRISLDRGPNYCRIFRDKEDGCLKTIIKF